MGVKGGTECRRDIVVEVMRAQPGDVPRREAVAAQEGRQAVRVIAGQEGEQGPLVLAEAAEDVRQVNINVVVNAVGEGRV